VEIDGEHYWDGGLVSNTPLQYVIEYYPRRSHLVFQVDLFPARGALPGNLNEVTERDKDIRYSSRTRAGIHRTKTEQLATVLLPDPVAAHDTKRDVVTGARKNPQRKQD
jgi:predicted acylesterase/phospholipase RssA